MAQTELSLVAGSIPAGETPEVQEDFWVAQPRKAQQYHFGGIYSFGFRRTYYTPRYTSLDT